MKRKRLTQIPQKRVRLTQKTASVEKESAVAPSGMYGYTKGLERTVQASINKIKRKALKLATTMYKKDSSTSKFLSVHATRSKSASAHILMEAMKTLGPKFAHKEASGGYGMYGYRSKTASKVLMACAELKGFAGAVAADLHRRQAAKYDKVMGFLKSHHKQAGCNCSKMMMSYYPKRDMKFASEDPLRSKLIRLAHENPALRSKILPLLTKKSSDSWIEWEDWEE